MSPEARRAPARGRRAFADTWWGRAWVAALEDSTLDAGRLSRGRTYARQGKVGQVSVSSGLVKAPVQGSDFHPYRTSVRVPALTDSQWDTLLNTIATRAGHTAALLDGEMPEDLVEDARAAGVPLLPLPTELDPKCSCPDWGYPCKHAAALCYAIASGIDADPFVLFALRGRTKEKVFAELRRLPYPRPHRRSCRPGRCPLGGGLCPLGRRAPRAARAARPRLVPGTHPGRGPAPGLRPDRRRTAGPRRGHRRPRRPTHGRRHRFRAPHPTRRRPAAGR